MVKIPAYFVKKILTAGWQTVEATKRVNTESIGLTTTAFQRALVHV